MNADDLLRALQIIRSARGLIDSAGINYAEVEAAQAAAEAEGREFGAADAQVFIGQAQSAVDRL